MGDTFGADKYVKKYALEFGYTYKELNPAHTNKNLYSVMNESWYGKVYTHKNVYLRDKLFSEIVDIAMVFETDKKTENIIKQFHKLNKKIVVIG